MFLLAFVCLFVGLVQSGSSQNTAAEPVQKLDAKHVPDSGVVSEAELRILQDGKLELQLSDRPVISVSDVDGLTVGGDGKGPCIVDTLNTQRPKEEVCYGLTAWGSDPIPDVVAKSCSGRAIGVLVETQCGLRREKRRACHRPWICCDKRKYPPYCVKWCRCPKLLPEILPMVTIPPLIPRVPEIQTQPTPFLPREPRINPHFTPQIAQPRIHEIAPNIAENIQDTFRIRRIEPTFGF